MIKIEVRQVIPPIVENILPLYTKDKILHICVEVRYNCYPRGPNSFSDKIEHRIFIHYIFYRPDGNTKVLYREGSSRCLEDENNKIFYMTSYHDSCWRIDGARDLFKIQMRIIKSIEKQYKKITKRNMSRLKKLEQPTSCALEIELLDGEASGHGHKNREYKLEIKDGKTNFIQIEEKEEKNERKNYRKEN